MNVQLKNKLLFYVSPDLFKKKSKTKISNLSFNSKEEIAQLFFVQTKLSESKSSAKRKINSSNLKSSYIRNLFGHNNYNPNIEGKIGRSFIETIQNEKINTNELHLIKKLWTKCQIERIKSKQDHKSSKIANFERPKTQNKTRSNWLKKIDVNQIVVGRKIDDMLNKISLIHSKKFKPRNASNNIRKLCNNN